MLYRLFQSTPPARGATYHGGSPHAAHHDFNPRPPRGGRRKTEIGAQTLYVISIHAPREGGDVKHFFGISGHFVISIHAPREGGDAVAPSLPSPSKRPFQSTPPARGATSLHLLTPRVATDFNPRPPRGGRRAVGAVPQSKEISIHAPREGGDAAGRSYIPHQAISIHAPREGGRRWACTRPLCPAEFQSTPPARGATPRPVRTATPLTFQSTPPARGATITPRLGVPLQP